MKKTREMHSNYKIILKMGRCVQQHKLHGAKSLCFIAQSVKNFPMTY